MVENANSELRRIRITLIILAIIVAFTSGGRTVSIDHESYDSDFNEDEPVYNSNMVPLEDRYSVS
ncbi:hypothetical protein BCI9360_03842 [Bacillus sp. CECT 9360]|nr:hypothetical protein BCI9360_03842 [Bacillus sp. CECT 9360]